MTKHSLNRAVQLQIISWNSCRNLSAYTVSIILTPEMSSGICL